MTKRIVTGFFIGLLGLGMLGGMGYYAFTLFSALIEDRDVFAHGVAAPDGAVEGTQRSRRVFFHEYKLTLKYADQKGVRHTVKQEFDTVLGEVERDAKVAIHYDPAHPERAASSWSVDVTVSRAAWAFFAAAMAALGAFVIYAGILAGRNAVHERAAAREGREIRVHLTEQGTDQYGNTTYAVRAEVEPGDTVTDKVTLNKRSPWRLGSDAALGLYLPGRRRLFLVESDGQPVVLDDAELAASRERAAA